MPTRDDVLWFKTQFQPRIEPLLANSPLTVDFLAAIACQETGYVWSRLRARLPIDQVLALCVGDTLDDDKGRSAFPRNKAALLAAAHGDEMYTIARQALIDMSKEIPSFAAVAKRPNKFCHGFGMFQRDLQFFKSDPDYFLEKRYATFEGTLECCLEELGHAAKRLGFEGRALLTDMELAAVGIAYNTGSFTPKKGLRQGFFDGQKFYGEQLFDFLQMAHRVALPGNSPLLTPPRENTAVVPSPSPVIAQGTFLRVDTKEGMLRLRSEPKISDPPQANVVGHMPDGQPVRAFTGKARNGFREVETSLNGALLRGFASQKYLVADTGVTEIPIVTASEAPPVTGVVAVFMPSRPGHITKRSDPAGAHSLNEPNQPTRAGTSPDELRASLSAIIDWLAVDKAAHGRYQPHDGLTFCNIYCHDYCHLADVYLPRVWWTTRAILALTQGQSVEPLIGDTIAEMRANDLFRWLRDFGPTFGWRQTGTLTKLQQTVNQGAIGLIVARRKEDGRSGHIVAVVPESAVESARRDAMGEVTAPLQSQAGATNFRYGKGRANWWNGMEFAESAFWVHA
ncbi:hypothetical protein P3W85_17635 [Cupriavidus basilensis]|uniref:Uncharacterized protein n=1 Tax=Cupriavidus basilensis TaxID=68895 RepID=A0ABT6AQ82_9BURK|nr:hypothetical protein [Cupriavidus basilensis]MDF3834766.1 hypothetical protein [Cupriavidus basilensis]